MELFSEERSAQVVTASFADTPDPRLKQLMAALRGSTGPAPH
jgi:hypothetical protein